MAKKKSGGEAKRTAKKGPAKGAAAGKGGKKKPAKKAPVPEIVLDAVETKALDLVRASQAVCHELEAAAMSALSRAVRQVFKQHRITLNDEQAENVAMVLFGE
ncbi:MAG: hypothetical protein ABSG68_15030 [Thermoguttaceae bacterium]|jgi:hypothetical protein